MREIIAKAVKIYRTARMDDDEVYKRLVADGVDRNIAGRLVEFLPLAYGRIFFTDSGAKFSESYLRVDKHGHLLPDEQPLASVPIWNEIIAFAQSEIDNGTDKVDLFFVAFNSSEFQAIVDCLKKGEKPSDLVFSPPMFLHPEDDYETKQTIDKLQKDDDSLSKKKRWQFWR
jgi:hypothetical protein